MVGERRTISVGESTGLIDGTGFDGVVTFRLGSSIDRLAPLDWTEDNVDFKDKKKTKGEKASVAFLTKVAFDESAAQRAPLAHQVNTVSHFLRANMCLPKSLTGNVHAKAWRACLEKAVASSAASHSTS